MKKGELQRLNVLFCAFVTLIHLLSFPIMNYAAFTPMWTVAFSLQRPLFCAVSGFLFLSALKTSLAGVDNGFLKVIKRIKRLWIPYVIAVVVYCIFEYYTKGVRSEFAFFKDLLTGRHASHFYFVIVITQFYILHRFILNTVKRAPRISLALSFVISVVTNFACDFEYYNLLFTRYLFCYTIGCIAGVWYDKFLSYLKKKQLPYLFVIALLTDLVSALLSSFGYISPVIQQLVTTICIPVMILFFLRVVLPIETSVFIKRTDSRTYHIYLWHLLFIRLSLQLCSHLGILSIPLTFIISVALTLAGISIIILIPNKKERL